MEYIKFLKKDKNKYYYAYQIEGFGEWGELWYNPIDDIGACNKLAENDTEENERYRNHAFNRIAKNIKNSYFPEKAELIAWG